MDREFSRTNKEYQSIYGVSRSTIARWRKAGLPLDDELEMERVRAADGLGGKGRSPESLEGVELKEAVLRAELRRRLKHCEKLEIEVERARGELVNRSDVLAEGQALGVAFRTSLQRLENDLPPMLDGLPASGMKKVIRGFCRQILLDMDGAVADAVARGGGV